jgi:hypothetical protein
MQIVKKLVKDITLTLLLTVTLSGFTIQSFVLKTGIITYILATFLASLFFAVALKNVKLGLLYALIATFIGALISWAAIVLPPIIYEESFMISFATEVYTYFIARFTLLSLPGIIFGVLMGSIISGGI